MPKLTKKHRTFDCELTEADYHQQQQQQLQQQQQPAPLPPLPVLQNFENRPVENDNFDTNQTQSSQYQHQSIYTPNAGVKPPNSINHLDSTNNSTIVAQPQPIPSDGPHDDCQQIDVKNHAQLDQMIPSQQLSKLTLSSSLHQMNENSKFLTNNNNNNNNYHQHHHQPNAQPKINSINNNDYTMNHHHINQQQQLQQQQNATPNNQQKTNCSNKSPNKKREADLDTVHVVVGNEACDLDSAVSCLLMFHIISKMSDEINGKDKTKTLYIPLLNTTRDMLESKCEVLWFLQKTLNIDKSFLTCKDDIDWNEIKKNGIEVLITLVDHNYNDEFKDIGKIVEIIDHHQVQNPKWLMENHSNLRLTLDTSVGSCTTLVAERLFYIYAEHHVSDEILLLIYGTVLLDTICLSEKAKRFTRRDVYLLKKLDSLLGSKKPVRDELYKQLVEIKNSTRELDFEKLMKRDLKIYKDKHGMRIGIASLFGMAAKEALGLAANIDLDLFFRENNYEAFVIMGLVADIDHSDSISRDLVLISANHRLFDELCNAFEMDTSKLDLLQVGPTDSSPDPEDNILVNKKLVFDEASNSAASSLDIKPSLIKAPLYKAKIWLQRNVSSSRKVVAPLVLKVLHDGAE